SSVWLAASSNSRQTPCPRRGPAPGSRTRKVSSGGAGVKRWRGIGSPPRRPARSAVAAQQRQYTQPSPTGYVETATSPRARCCMLGPPKASHRDELFLDSFEQRLPATNFYRKLDAQLDLSFVRAWVAAKYAAIG